MVQINFAQKTVNVKIVYYGPGMSGKTTNLEVVHQRAPSSNRGELTSISTDGDRTLFFDYMPLDLGTVAGMRTCFQVYTVPGQVYYNSTRKLVLQGVDGVIFIADSSASMLDQNIESLRNLEENLNEYGKSIATMPHVMQWNKRDLPDAMQVEELERHLNLHGVASFEGVANTGQGVFPTLKALAASVLKSIMKEAGGAKSGTGTTARPAPASASPPAPAHVPHPAEAPPRAAAPAPEMVTPAAGGPMPPAQSVPHAPAGQPPEVFHEPAAASAGPPAQGGQPHPTEDVGLGAQQQTARPVTQAQAPAPAPQSSPVEMMQPSPAATPAHAPRSDPRTHTVPVPGAAARRSRPARDGGRVAPQRQRGGGFATGAFVLLAAGAGAALAWVVLTVL